MARGRLILAKSSTGLSLHHEGKRKHRPVTPHHPLKAFLQSCALADPSTLRWWQLTSCFLAHGPTFSGKFAEHS